MSSGEVKLVIDTLNTGIELETRGIRFYSKAASEVEDPRGRQTLRFLEGEEKDHLGLMKKIRRTFEKKEQGIGGEIITSHLRNKAAKVFPQLEEYVEEVKAGQGDKKILDEAAEIEKRSINLYKEARRGVTERGAIEVFDFLVKEEEGHLKLVEQMADYMVVHGMWSGLEDYFANE